jgi:putative phosphoserine phosphatase/1-acylglycerol-3-phosphate O-acyltransferase
MSAVTLGLRGRFGRAADTVRTDFQHYLQGLGSDAQSADAIAFFDLDRTLIARYSVTALVLERMRSGAVPLRRLLSSASAFLGYGLGRADYHELLSATLRDLVGEPEEMLTELGERAFRQRVEGWIYAEARALIDAHRREGHHIVIVTSATRYQAAPIARALEVDRLCCTELEVHDGRITGRALPCFGVGKLTAAELVARERAADLTGSFFYSDSSDDLPLLEAVGRPVVVNPRSAMARLARSRGWPCLVFEPPGDARPAAA